MSRRGPWVGRRGRRAGVGAALVLAVLGTLVAACRRGVEEETKPGTTQLPVGPTEQATVSLLFPGPDGKLHAESRELAVPLGADARVAAVIAALLAGPKTAGLVAPLPEGVAVADAFVDGDGVAYLDLAAKDQPAPPPAGSDLELLRVYSLVDTVIANEPRARSVVLLWNGVQRPTFSGHVDTASPLLEDRTWIK
jgi:hypothetical protein